MVILRTRNKITDFFMILAWASPFKACGNDVTPCGIQLEPPARSLKRASMETLHYSLMSVPVSSRVYSRTFQLTWKAGLSVSILYRVYSIIAIGSRPSRSRPGLGLDFGLINFKSNSLILDIAH